MSSDSPIDAEVTFEELHQEYLREIDAKVAAEHALKNAQQTIALLEQANSTLSGQNTDLGDRLRNTETVVQAARQVIAEFREKPMDELGLAVWLTRLGRALDQTTTP